MSLARDRARIRTRRPVRSLLAVNQERGLSRCPVLHDPTPRTGTASDALAFPDGHIVLVNLLSEGQQARVLQLPVIPREHRASAEKASTPAADLALTV